MISITGERTLVRENAGNLGLYAVIERPGKVEIGDSIKLLD